MRTSLGIWALGSMVTRFVPGGYQPEHAGETTADRVRRAVSGLGDLIDDYEFHYPGELDHDNLDEVKSALGGHGIYTICTGLHLDPRFGRGGLVSPDPAVRAEARRMTRETAEMAGAVGANMVCWPGIEGYNYPFQTPYAESWAWFLDGIAEAAETCAAHGVTLFLEHKNSEPAMKILMRNIGMTLHVIHMLRARGITNVKVNMDWQHLLMNGESLGEYAAMLAAEGLLGHLHANSGWGTFDDDNMVGATAFMETLELAVELRRARYGENGERLGFDLYPYTEDAVAAVARSVRQWNFIWDVSGRIDDAGAARGAVAQGRRARLRARLRRARRRVRAAAPRYAASARSSAARPFRSTGSPCETSTRVTGRSSSGRSDAASRSWLTLSGSQLCGHMRTPPGAPSRTSPATRPVLREPVDHLVRPGGGNRPHPAGQDVARTEWLRGRRTTAYGGLPRGGREHPGAVTAGQHVRVARVPEHGHEHDNRLADLTDQHVERVVRRQQRVDQHELVQALVRDRADVLLPLGMERRPPPESRSQLTERHGG